MTAGDVVAVKIKSAGAGRLNYQPAAGVEICITGLVDSIQHSQIYDGTDGANIIDVASTSNPRGNTAGAHGDGSLKFWFTNTVYYSQNAAGAGEITYLMGVQTK